MGSSQATAAGHVPVSDVQKDYSFPGTTLPNGQPVINHYIQACIAYGPIVGCASRGQFGTPTITTTTTKSNSSSTKLKGGYPRRGTIVPSISTEGAMRLRQHSSLSPLGALKASSSSPTSSNGNFFSPTSATAGGGGGSKGGGETESLNVLAVSSGSPRSAFPSPAAFAVVCEQGALDLHTRNARNGKRSGVYNGVYFYILSSVPEEKVFSAHMKGLEAIDALRLPSVQVPRTAKVFFLGLTMACIELVSIHGISRYPTSVAAVVAPSPPPQLPPSAHSRVVSVIISRAYRLTGDPSIVMYESGSGSLVVVDACGLLPALAVRATSLKPWHSSRFEAIIGYDFPKSVASSLQCGQLVPSSTTSKNIKEEFPMMRAVLNAALHYPKKKHVSVSNLHFLMVGQNIGSNHHFDDVYVCTSQPLPPTELAATSPYAIRIPKSTDSNATFTAILFKGVIPSFVEAFDLECTSNASHFMSVAGSGGGGGGGVALGTLADKRTFSQNAFVALMKRCGLGIHMLGHLWTISKNKPGDNGRALRYHVGTEMLARATKRILHDTLARTILPTTTSGKTAASSPVSHQTVVDAVMAVFRGVAEEQFRESELVPLVSTMFNNSGGGDAGGGIVPRVGKDVSYHSMLARVEELTGIITENGTLQSIRPFCRVAKTGLFPLNISPQEELRLCTVASKREDGMAGAATVSAVSFHRRNVARIGTVLDQLRSRAQYPTDPAATLSDTATLMQMFVAMIELTLISHAMYAPTLPVYGGGAGAGHSASAQNRTSWLQGTIPDKRVEQYIKLSHASEHDKMFIAHYLLMIADKLLRTPSTITQGALVVRQVLGLGLFQNSVSVHPVASRYLQEQLHRVSVEACYATNQLKEALAISKRWFRTSCVALFGGSSEAYFEATRMMMVALIRSKRKREATRVAQRQYDLAELVYGGKVSIHSVELPASQVVDIHCDVSRRLVDTSQRGGRSGGGMSPSTLLMNNTAVLRIASAANDLGSLTWRHAPVCGLVHFRRAIAIYNAVYGAESKATATTTYNIGLALLRLNQFGASQKHIKAARRTAINIDDERGLVQLCDASLKSLTLISATKIQRWYRSIKYGVAKSQTTRTDTTTTFQSALSWSDELSEISSSGQQ